MLANEAHIKLDDDFFLIDESIEGHYSHRFTSLKAQRLDITGSPGKQQLDGESLMWTYDDWAGGEGNRIYYADEYDMYDVGYELNPRVRGQLMGRPVRDQVTVTAANVDHRPMMCVGDGAVWIGGGLNLAYSRGAPGTWTEKSVTEVGLNPLSTAYKMTALVGDHEWVYLSGWHSAASGSRALLQVSRSDTGSPNTVVTEATSKPPYAGLAILEGKLYAWTGRRLYEHDIDQSFPLAADKIRKVYDSGVDPTSTNVFSQDWWAEVKATENSIIMWYATQGQTEVYEYKKGVGRPIWRPPYGFTVKGSEYQNGVMYFSGHWGGDSVLNGWGALYALPLDSYRPIHLKWVRKFQNDFATGAQMQEVAGSYGSQVMFLAQKKGQVYIYDAESDGLTMLDDLTRATGADPDGLAFTSTHRGGGLVTMGPYRYLSVYDSGGSGAGTYQIVYYKDDEPDQRATGLNVTNYTGADSAFGFGFESPKWDYDYPMERKNLMGFHLTFKPLISGQFLDVSYSVDDGAYTSLTQITSATSGASVGRVFLPVTGVKFFQLKFRVRLTSSTDVLGPILYGVTAESKLVRKREVWELILRLKDEVSGTRLAGRQSDGSTLRDWLEATVEAGSVVTFLDGYRYKEQLTPRSTTHSVTIEEMEDVINEAGEGSCRVLLVAATEAT